MEVNVNLDGTGPEARHASELARELIAARALGVASEPPEKNEALGRVTTEVLAGEASEALAARVGYILSALSLVATMAVVAARLIARDELDAAVRAELSSTEGILRFIYELIEKNGVWV